MRLGGLAEAYKRVGYTPRRNLAWIERDQGLGPIRLQFICDVVATLKDFGAVVQQDVRRQCLTVNENLNVRASITRCRTLTRINSWFQLCSPFNADVTVFARLAPGNEAILDYFCVPQTRKLRHFTVSSQTPIPRYVQRFSDLTFRQDLADMGKTRG